LAELGVGHVRYAHGVVAAWTRRSRGGRGGAAELEPGHLLVALCKPADAEAGSIAPDDAFAVAAELRELRAALAGVDVGPVSFRRRLCAQLARTDGLPPAGNPSADQHRTPAARRAFIDAEAFAQRQRAERLEPVHLLSVLVELEDPEWQRVLVALEKPPPGGRGRP
jgi:hypothetical protein